MQVLVEGSCTRLLYGHRCFAMESEFLYGNQNGALFPMLAIYNKHCRRSGFSLIFLLIFLALQERNEF